ncbi:hypothetical protein J6590_011047 [Homalodisca vitripennis]|nr:hypothetical protein J6590_011047 [Homalodisca vitripennis]
MCRRQKLLIMHFLKHIFGVSVVSLYILSVITYAHENNFTRGRDVHQHNTRYAADFALPQHHSAQFEEKPSYMGAKLFNCLPADIKSQENIKKTLKTWLLKHPFYSINEFLSWRTFDINM